MKKVISFLLIFATMLLFSSCAGNHDFRNVDFGMTREEVRNAEKNLEPQGALEYSITINTVPCIIEYEFDENDCLDGISGKCNVSKEGDFVQEFEKLKEYLDDICGESIRVIGDGTFPWVLKDYDISYRNGCLQIFSYNDEYTGDHKYISFSLWSAGNYDFRNVDFGMTRQEVQKAEKESKPHGELKYSVTINTVPCIIEYEFDENDCLDRISGNCDVSKEGDFVKEFEKLKEYLDDICGEGESFSVDSIHYDNGTLRRGEKYIHFFLIENADTE